MRPAPIVALSAIALAAGFTPVRAAIIVGDTVESGYDHSDFVAAADGKQFKVVVMIPDPNLRHGRETEQLILSSLQAADPADVRTTFVAGQASFVPNVTDYHFVVAVNLGGNVTGEDLCAPDPKMTPAAAGPGRLRITLSFCRTDELLSTATAITNASLDDPAALRSAMSELMTVMLPAHTNHRTTNAPGNVK
ncbi:hypothetical protein [Vineibacter terrae]|uniref:hypothetical protein n=1 Tax=Vineibacter terrae TaxID=2586908 RepID=UPI002E3364A5|nr:hypothetical protein [Vineibacter terrae]HEX2886860.1 hypothetical protein [Vineibacter terrae]